MQQATSNTYCLNDGCPTSSSSAPPSTCSYYCRLFIEFPITTDLTMFWLQSCVSPSQMKPVGREDGWKESHERISLNQPEKSWFQLTPTRTGPHYSCTRKELQSLFLPGSTAGQKAHLFCSRSGISSLLHSSLEWGKGMSLVFVPGFALSDLPTAAYEPIHNT